MRIDDLMFFSEICRHSSFSQAAQTLHITQQGLSQRMRKLEEEIGSDLFLRSSRGVTLTPFGEEFYQQTAAVLEQFSLLEELAEKHREAGRQHLRIGMRISSNASAMTSAITCTVDDFCHLHREIETDIIFDPQEELLDMLNEGTLDTAHVIGPVDRTKFEVYPVFSFRLKMLAHKSLNLGPQKTVRIADLSDLPVVMPSEENPLYDIIMNLLHAEGVEPKQVMHESNAKTLIYMVNRGYGVGFLPQNSTAAACKIYPDLRQYQTSPSANLEYSFAVSRLHPVSDAVQTMIDYVQTGAKGNFISASI